MRITNSDIDKLIQEIKEKEMPSKKELELYWHIYGTRSIIVTDICKQIKEFFNQK